MSVHRFLSRALAVSLVGGAMAITAQPAQAATFSEGFDDITTLTTWQKVNLSDPTMNPTTWRQGDPTDFAAQAGAESSYIAVDYTSGGENVSNWLISPKQTSLSSTDVLSFWSRTINLPGGTIYPDRLEVRMSSNGSCSPGTTVDGVGDFTTLLTSINPTLAGDGYPRTWTQYNVPLTGLSTTNVSGCLAFRYYITNTDDNGETVGIDSLTFTDNASTACTNAQTSATAAQTTVTAAQATATTAAKVATKAAKKLKKARKALKKAKKADDEAKVTKAKKKVKKTKKASKKAKKKNAAAKAALSSAQTALSTAQTTVTSSCP